MLETVKCPFCAEEIKPEAKKCKHCGEWLPSEAFSSQTGNTQIPSAVSDDKRAETSATDTTDEDDTSVTAADNKYTVPWKVSDTITLAVFACIVFGLGWLGLQAIKAGWTWFRDGDITTASEQASPENELFTSASGVSEQPLEPPEEKVVGVDTTVDTAQEENESLDEILSTLVRDQLEDIQLQTSVYEACQAQADDLITRPETAEWPPLERGFFAAINYDLRSFVNVELETLILRAQVESRDQFGGDLTTTIRCHYSLIEDRTTVELEEVRPPFLYPVVVQIDPDSRETYLTLTRKTDRDNLPTDRTIGTEIVRREFDLEPGVYDFEVNRFGYSTFEGTFEVPSKQGPKITLKASPTVSVRFTSSPTGVTVTLPNDFVGRTPFVTKLPKNARVEYQASLEGQRSSSSPNYQPISGELRFSRDSTHKLKLRLIPSSAEGNIPRGPTEPSNETSNPGKFINYLFAQLDITRTSCPKFFSVGAKSIDCGYYAYNSESFMRDVEEYAKPPGGVLEVDGSLLSPLEVVPWGQDSGNIAIAFNINAWGPGGVLIYFDPSSQVVTMEVVAE